MAHTSAALRFPDAVAERTGRFLAWYRSHVVHGPVGPVTYAEHDGIGYQWDIEARVGTLSLFTAGHQCTGTVWLDQVDVAELDRLIPPLSLLLRVWADLCAEAAWITADERRALAPALLALAVEDTPRFGEPIYA